LDWRKSQFVFYNWAQAVPMATAANGAVGLPHSEKNRKETRAPANL
jgi:hypothetical protein